MSRKNLGIVIISFQVFVESKTAHNGLVIYNDLEDFIFLLIITQLKFVSLAKRLILIYQTLIV